MSEIKLIGKYIGGRCWDVLTEKRMADSRALENFGYKVYSQNDEDGILHEIFRRIGTTTKEFIEFGVQNGLESNCHFLLHQGWKGLWIDGNKSYYHEIRFRFRPVIAKKLLRVVNAFITKDNIEELLEENAFSLSPDLLSIDIDGNDWYIWDSIQKCNPRVVCIEYNGKFPPDIEWKQAYNPDHIWNESDWQGASLRTITQLGNQKGYRLVCTNLNGVNAFFVRNDLINDSFFDLQTPEELYNPLRLELAFAAPGHHAEFCLAEQEGFASESDYFPSEEAHQKYLRLSHPNLVKRVMRKLK